ncbi:hypothetical protein GWI33_014779 [Rhynchophorus ferrugineus]|uniref:Uncharacterized protein n=1 Tax=Rhynchophorus ferrugineus TaxID=354439 RepID=A0A834I0S1_RHYFE|nr:hypothetical protein GWI33_014779 [Rhynchophorus ferrugineus]
MIFRVPGNAANLNLAKDCSGRRDGVRRRRVSQSAGNVPPLNRKGPSPQSRHAGRAPSDPLTACLDADGTYICTAFNPRCYIIQKVNPPGLPLSPPLFGPATCGTFSNEIEASGPETGVNLGWDHCLLAPHPDYTCHHTADGKPQAIISREPSRPNQTCRRNGSGSIVGCQVAPRALFSSRFTSSVWHVPLRRPFCQFGVNLWLVEVHPSRSWFVCQKSTNGDENICGSGDLCPVPPVRTNRIVASPLSP